MHTQIKTGSKFFRFFDNEEKPEIIRIISDDGIIIEYFNENNEKKKMPVEDIDNYTLLKPDGLIIFTIVKLNDSKDVIVVLRNTRRDAKPLPFDDLPFAICRQCIYDVFSNNLRRDPDKDPYHVELSISQETCPADVDFAAILSCHGLVYQRPIAIYIDDNLDTILSLFRHKKFDDVLEFNSSTPGMTDTGIPLIGYSHTLRELLESNNFMYDFRRCFNIEELPFEIGDADQLSALNREHLQKITHTDIIETYVTKFTKEIALDEIKRDYILAASAAEKYNTVYLVGYDNA